MSVNSILITGMQNMQAGINRTAIAGSTLNVESGDFAMQLVAMQQGSLEAKAAANIIKTGDELLGTLIDIHG